MRVIGITGGIGAGKSQILSYIKNDVKHDYHCEIILADEVAHRVKEPGQPCYEALVRLLGREILLPGGEIDKKAMAEKIFHDDAVLKLVNGVIHPAVKDYILSKIAEKRKEGKLDFLFIEAALLIEEGYGSIVDELWYIHAKEEVRRKRLKESRNYSDEKITGILRNQLSEEEYRKHCKVVIDNSGALQDTYRQIDEKLEEYL